MADDGRPPRTASWAATGVPAGRFLGIPVYVAPSWFLIAAVVTYLFAQVFADNVPGLGMWRYAMSGGFALLLYGSVLVHELSHSAVARALGLPVRRILLTLLGGLSEIAREPGSAGREYLVAVAGPLTSVILGGVGLAVAAQFADGTPAHELLHFVGEANVWVAAFNMLPGLPLDGGRVLRAALWGLLSDQHRATRAAAHVGRALAVVLAILPFTSMYSGGSIASGYGLYGWLLAWFIWAGASQHLAGSRVREALPRLSARGLARTPLSVPSDLPLAEALRRAQESGARALVTVDALGRPAGIVSEAAAVAVPTERRPWVPVSSVTHEVHEGIVLPVDAGGEDLLQALRTSPSSEYLLVDGNGQVQGVLAQSDVVDALQEHTK